MCYSAQIDADYQKLLRHFGPVMDYPAFARLWLRQNGGERDKIPKGLVETMRAHLDPAVVDELDARFAEDEQAWQTELFKQSKRKADNERKLASKYSVAASEHVRIAGNKIDQLKRWINDLHRRELRDSDWRFFPQWWVPVLLRDGDGYVIRPMRYQLRRPGQPASSDYVTERGTKRKRLSGTYNARRDNLERYWKHQFGHTHALMVVDKFWENVEMADGRNERLEFTPRTGEPMLVACLWSTWTDPAGIEPDLPCFAAITDEPEPEVAAAGHDRTVINIKPEHAEAWLNPDPSDLAALYAIFDDKQHPYYESSLERAA